MAGGKRGRFLRRVREDELPSRVKEAGLGHDSVPASQGASFHRGFRRLRAATYFAHGGKVGKTPLPLEVGKIFPARKIRSAWVRLNPGPLGPWVYKI